MRSGNETADDRRHRWRSFDPSLITSFLDGRTIRSVTPLTGGRINSNFRLEIGDGQVVLFRRYARIAPGRETGAMELARRVVPVPRVLATGEGWAVHEFVAGVPLANHPAQAGRAAELLGRLATIGLPGHGWIEPDGSIQPFEFGDFRGYVGRRLATPEVARRLGAGRIAAIRALLERERERIAELDGPATLVHGDFNPTNILIAAGRVVAIVDWEFAHAGSPYMDIGNFLRHTPPEHRDTVARGLRRGGMALPDDWQRRAALVDLTSQLEALDTLRAEAHKARCLARIDALLT